MLGAARAGRRCPTSPPSLLAPAWRVSWAGLRSGAAHRLCCRNWPERPGRAAPPPRVETKGARRGGRGGALWRSCSWLARFVRRRRRRREGQASAIQRREALELRGRRPSAWGIACARSAIHCAGAAGAGPRAPRRGAVGRGPSCGWRAALRRPGRLGRWAERMGPRRR